MSGLITLLSTTDAVITVPASVAHFQALMPVLILAGFGLLILLLDAFQDSGSRQHLAWIALAGFASTFVAAWALWQNDVPRPLFGDMVYMDKYTMAFACIFALSGILTCMTAREYLKSHDMDRGEFYVLLLFATVGMILVASAADLIMVFLGLETMSISAYVLAALSKREKRSAEAGMKYLILGALATGLLLYGTALVYGTTGTTNLQQIGENLAGNSAALEDVPLDVISAKTVFELSADSPEELAVALAGLEDADATSAADVAGTATLAREHRFALSSARSVEVSPLAFMGMILILVAFGFKIGAVPFHMWAPDVYSGAPTPAVGFMATAVKAAAFAGLIRVLVLAFFADAPRISATGWVQILFGIAMITMIVGNFAAIVQNQIKRMLAYSSIAHAGYILVGIVAAGYVGSQNLLYSVVFYLVAYTFATVGAFGVLTYFGRKGEEVETYADLDGLGQKHPWAGFAMVVFMLSAAGIPPTAGFFAKFLVFKAAVDAGAAGGAAPSMMFMLAAFGILASVAGIYYYLKVIVHMYMRDRQRVIRPLTSWATAVALAVCTAGSLLLGILPGRVTTYSTLAAHHIADSPDGPEAVPFEDSVPEQDGDDAQADGY